MQHGAHGKRYGLGALKIDTRSRDLRAALRDMTLITPVSATREGPAAPDELAGLPELDDVEEQEEREGGGDDEEARQDRFRLGEAHQAMVPPETEERNQAIDVFMLQESDDKNKYRKLRPVVYKVSEVQRMYERHDWAGLLEILMHRSRFVLDPHTIIDHSEGKEMISAEPSRIDFKCIVGKETGLGVLCRVSATNQTTSFTLLLHSPHLQFHHSHGKLGFDPTGNLLFVGKRGDEEVWLAWAPDGVEILRPSGPPGSGTQLSTPWYRLAVLFWAYALSQLEHLNVRYNERHLASVTFNPLVSAQDDLRKVTNILELKCGYSLNTDQVRTLDVIFHSQWRTWVDDLSETLREDEWVTGLAPVGILKKYGQDLPFGRAGDHAQEKAIFMDECDYSAIRYYSMAVMTPLKAQHVKEWLALSNDELEAKYPGQRFYRQPFGRREAVDLAQLPTFDGNGAPIPLWLENGKKAGRYRCRKDDLTDVGLLVDLEKVDGLFHPDEDVDVIEVTDLEEEEQTEGGRRRKGRTKYQTYPLAFTKQAGHVQADGHLRACDGVIAQMNEVLGLEEAGGRKLSPVKADSVQLYSYYVHAAFQDARNISFKKGTNTAGMVYERLGGSQKGKAKQFAEEADHKLPWQLFNEMTAKGKCPLSLRIETTIVIDVELMAAEYRNGGLMYEEVLLKFHAAMADPGLIGRLRPHLIVMRPNMFPEIFKYTTSPVYIVQQSLRKAVSLRRRGGMAALPHHVELAAVLDRVMSIAHTGNFKVLSKELLGPLFPYWSMKEGGVPTFNREIMPLGVNGKLVALDKWPMRSDGLPAQVSSATLTYYFGATCAEEQHFRLAVQMIEHQKRHLHGCDLEPYENRIGANLFSRVCKVWMEEIRGMVLKSGKERVRVERLENVEYAKWERAMTDFRTRARILTRETLAEMMIVLEADPEERGHGLEGLGRGGGGITTRELAKQLLSAGRGGKKQPRDLPIVSRSKVPALMQVVLATQTVVGMSSESIVGVMVWCLEKYYRVSYVPDLERSRMGVGSWRHVQSGGKRVREEEREEVEPEEAAAAAAFASHPGAAWSLNEVGYWPNEMWRIGEHQVAPEETQGSGGETASVFWKESTEWAREEFDPEEGIFLLAILIAKQVSKMTPYVYTVPNAMKLAQGARAKSAGDFHAVMRESEWVLKEKNGAKHESNVFVHWYIVLVSMMHPGSPLRRKRLDGMGTMNETEGDGGTSWSQRASNKGATVAALVGLGIANCRGAAGLEGKGYKKGWDIKSLSELNGKWKKIARELKEGGTNGLYEVSVELLGAKGAERLLQNEKSIISPARRERAVLMSDEEMKKLKR